jgi:hypothetical protein
MKKILFAAVAATSLMSAPAFAAPIDLKAFIIGASVAPECSLEAPSNVDFGQLGIETDPGAGALRITNNESDTQRVWASCNYPVKVRLRSTLGGLRTAQLNDGPDSADFTNVIFYRLSLEASDGLAFQPVELLTTGTPLEEETVNQADAFHDRARLRVRVLRADNPLRPLAGAYGDIAIVTLGAI